jgi:hypothetical protein
MASSTNAATEKTCSHNQQWLSRLYTFENGRVYLPTLSLYLSAIVLACTDFPAEVLPARHTQTSKRGTFGGEGNGGSGSAVTLDSTITSPSTFSGSLPSNRFRASGARGTLGGPLLASLTAIVRLSSRGSGVVSVEAWRSSVQGQIPRDKPSDSSPPRCVTSCQSPRSMPAPIPRPGRWSRGPTSWPARPPRPS